MSEKSDLPSHDGISWKRVRAWLSNAQRQPVVPRPGPLDARWGQRAQASIQRLQARFEGREAILVEKGALRVRISNIAGSVAQRQIWADIVEIITPNLGVGSFSIKQDPGRHPLMWQIGGGYLTAFSDQCWSMGYGGWSLYIDPRAIQAVLDLASRFPRDLKSGQRYSKVLDVLQSPQLHPTTNWQRIFPEPTIENTST